MEVKEILGSREQVEYHSRQPVWYDREDPTGHWALRSYFYVTNLRLILYQPSVWKKTAFIDVLNTEVTDVSYSEKERSTSTEGFITIATPNKQIRFKGSATTMRAIYQEIRSLPELRKAMLRQQEERERIQREKRREEMERQQEEAERQLEESKSGAKQANS